LTAEKYHAAAFICVVNPSAVPWLLKSPARISHRVSTAAADPGMSTALRSVEFLDVLSSTPAESDQRAPCIHARLRRLATKPVRNAD